MSCDMLKQVNHIKKLKLNDFEENIQEFISGYSCPLCEGILNDAVIDKCGHSYCNECIVELIKNEKKCPFSKLNINKNEIIKNTIVNSTIEKQTITCLNKEIGCKWKGKVNQRKEHLKKDCEFEYADCKYECGFSSERKVINGHEKECDQRKVNCKYCTFEILFSLIDEHYNTDCSLYPTTCKCGDEVLKVDFKKHVENECKLENVECPFITIGCEYNDQRQMMKKHLDLNLTSHLQSIISSFETINITVKSQNKVIEELQATNNLLRLELFNIKSNLNLQNEDLYNQLLDIKNENKRMKYYSIVPYSNYIPSFVNDVNSNIDNFLLVEQSFSSIFSIPQDSSSEISKISDNLGWFGTISYSLNLYNDLINMSDSNKINNFSSSSIININMKIINTSNSCIMLGLCINRSDIKIPLEGGFYKNTDYNTLAYYIYNHSIFKSGVLQQKGLANNQRKCISGDIITMTIDLLKYKIIFKVNGFITVDSISFPDLSYIINDEMLLRVTCDMSDIGDQIMFI